MGNQDDNIKQEKKADYSQQGESKSPSEKDYSNVIKIPLQFSAMKDAAHNGTPFCEVIKKNGEKSE